MPSVDCYGCLHVTEMVAYSSLALSGRVTVLIDLLTLSTNESSVCLSVCVCVCVCKLTDTAKVSLEWLLSCL